MKNRKASEAGAGQIATATDQRAFLGLFERSLPAVNRRDLLKSASVGAGVFAGALLWQQASAAPSPSNRTMVRYQDGEIVVDAEITVPLDPYGQPVVLDPHRAPNWGPFWVMYPNVWGGLLRYDQNGAVEFDLAEDMQVSDDNKVYTFTLRDGLKYASGNDVVAEDFITSWKRALQPGSLSPMSDFMSNITGYNDFVSGASEELGIAALDDRTVEIRLRQGFNYYPSLVASYVYSVIDPAAIEEFGEDDFPLHGAGTGPWQFGEFDPASQIVMTPNENYYDDLSPSITKINWLLLTGPDAASAALDLYEQDQVISADIPFSLKARAEGDEILKEELQSVSPAGSVRAIFFDFLQAPFDDVRVRLAVAHAVDREQWANTIWEGTWQAAGGFLPPVLTTLGEYGGPDGPEFDPARARSLLSDAGFPDGDGLPPIVCYRPAQDPAIELEKLQALFDMIEENSGIEIELNTSKSAEEIQAQVAEDGGKQVDVVWWWNLYETPHLLNEVFSPDSPWMRGYFNWNESIEPLGGYDPGGAASEFESLADDVDYEFDQDVRNELAAEAEELVLQNAVAVPLGYWVQHFVQKPTFQGARQGPWTGRLPVLFDKNVVVASE